MRILADHSRGTAALIADGVVPSNEDRGYVLRRIMRRAIHQGRSIGLESPFMEQFADRALDLLAPAYPELAAERDTVLRWAVDEEESFGRTLDRGMEMLRDLIRHAHEDRTSWVDAEDAFRLHDTYGFPYDLTKELLAEQGLSVDDEGFEELMEEQRDARADGDRERARLGGPPRRRAQLRLGGTALALRRLREAARRDQPARRPGRRRARPGQARGEPLLRGGRRPGR